jgi:two-component system, OmpR family, response regulator CpxR
MQKLLVIDDDRKLCELLGEYLAQQGFHVECVHDGGEGIRVTEEKKFDLIVLDVMLPESSGFEVLRHIRSKQSIPIIMLTARGDDVDRIVGLEMGADDYLPKPFNTRELVARIRTVLRRVNQDREEKTPGTMSSLRKMNVGDVEMDLGTRNVECSGKTITLTSVEFSLLEQLLKNAGNLVSREELTQTVLGRKLTAFDRSIDGYVCKLRKKLGRETSGVERIKAIRSLGYLYAHTDDLKKPNT